MSQKQQRHMINVYLTSSHLASWSTEAFFNMILKAVSSFRSCKYMNEYIQQLKECNKNKFLFLKQNTCCGYSQELSQWDGYFE